MQISCPNCGTRYDVEQETLAEAYGAARCHRCGCIFDGIKEEPLHDHRSSAPLELDAMAESHWNETPDRPTEAPPFEVPDDLEPLQPSADAGLDVSESLEQKRSVKAPVYTALAGLLGLGIAAQFAWQHRVELLERYPLLAPVCEQLRCVETRVHAPEQLRILERELRAADNQPGSLNLSARIRNDAEAAQPLPDIQLSLLDNNGSVLIRRRLSPGDYLYPPPSQERLMAPGEVITISIDFKDPGYLATGFVIDFL